MTYQRIWQATGEMKSDTEWVRRSIGEPDVYTSSAMTGNASIAPFGTEVFGTQFDPSISFRGGFHFRIIVANSDDQNLMFMIADGQDDTIFLPHRVIINASSENIQFWVDHQIKATIPFQVAGIQVNRWHKFGFELNKIGDDRIAFWLDGTRLFTENVQSSRINGVWFGYHSIFFPPNTDIIYDNVYVDQNLSNPDLTLPPENIFIPFVPDESGSFTEFISGTGAPNIDNIDDDVPDGHATYNYSLIPGQRDTFKFTVNSIPNSLGNSRLELRRIWVGVHAKRGNMAGPKLRAVLYDGMNSALSDPIPGIGPDYATFWAAFEKEPDGSNFTEEDLQSGVMEIGYEVI
ncbi:MAG: hypothetical protein KatS3mg087_1811 [Patescibacteria group bacterium]|nr:MAG: hypothetical protein KatS3mg087_1811 [Patescibacteria group bacterium]